jgi:hypothetical protein
MEVGVTEGVTTEPRARQAPPRIAPELLPTPPAVKAGFARPRATTILGLAVLVGVLAVIGSRVMSIASSEAGPSPIAELRQAETAAEAFATDHGGTYIGLGATELYRIAPTLGDGIGIASTAHTFVITLALPDGTVIRLWRRADGSELLTCAPVTASTCPPGSLSD